MKILGVIAIGATMVFGVLWYVPVRELSEEYCRMYANEKVEKIVMTSLTINDEEGLWETRRECFEREKQTRAMEILVRMVKKDWRD